jgi:hypothetical protein
MVKTTKGAADAPEKDVKPTNLSADDKRTAKALDLDDEVWGRIQTAATQSNRTPAEIVRDAISRVYGDPAPQYGFNSGNEDPPAPQDVIDAKHRGREAEAKTK